MLWPPSAAAQPTALETGRITQTSMPGFQAPASAHVRMHGVEPLGLERAVQLLSEHGQPVRVGLIDSADRTWHFLLSDRGRQRTGGLRRLAAGCQGITALNARVSSVAADLSRAGTLLNPVEAPSVTAAPRQSPPIWHDGGAAIFRCVAPAGSVNGVDASRCQNAGGRCGPHTKFSRETVHVELAKAEGYSAMDQGLAAVLGASVGVLGTMGTALLTYAATRGQVRDQGRVTHAHWLREARQRAYTEFVSAAVEAAVAARALDKEVRKIRTEGWVTQINLDALESADQAAFQSMRNLTQHGIVHLSLAGPGSLVSDGAEFVDAARDVLAELRRLRPAMGPPETSLDQFDELDMLNEKVDELFIDFQAHARTVVESPTS